ncbi:hypothetical protein DMH03_18245 [Amycolatopsis sp. WAC 01376]|nr:hypothetical protein DMH03_18245 [Amycolatopsis sp. WAC 01376]
MFRVTLASLLLGTCGASCVMPGLRYMKDPFMYWGLSVKASLRDPESLKEAFTDPALRSTAAGIHRGT